MANSISPSQLAEKLRQPSPPFLLDVRQPEEHAWVSLPNSCLIPLDELEARIEELESKIPPNSDIVVYCHHGIRSQMAIHILAAAGFSKLLNLSGGIDRWARELDPKMPRYP